MEKALVSFFKNFLGVEALPRGNTDATRDGLIGLPNGATEIKTF